MKYNNLILFDILKIEKITSLSERSFLSNEVFELLKRTYQSIEGGLHFKSPDDLVLKTSMWDVVYFQDSIIGVVIYKAKNGTKMVALALCNKLNKVIRKHAKKILSSQFQMIIHTTWMEVSEGLENFLLNTVGQNYIISNNLTKKIIGKEILEYCDDGQHYKREINGVIKTKLLMGNPKF